MACSRLEKKEITIEMAEQELRDIISPDEKREVTPELIINTVAEHFGIRPEDIKGKKRNSEIVFPRQIAMYLCREIIGIPLKSIGTIMGKKRPHHSYPRLQHHRRRHGKIRIHTQYCRDYQEENHTELTVIHRLRTKVPQKYSTAGTLDFTGFRTVIHKFTAPKNMTTDFL